MILEGLITTRSPDGTPHLAAMGPEVDAERLREGSLVELLLKPFATSQTARNLATAPEGVFQVTDDCLLLARTVAGRGPAPSLVRAQAVDGWRLADACTAWEFRIVAADRTGERHRLVARVERVHQGRPFQGHVRARHAVVEAAILVTRLHMLPEADVAARFADLAVLVEKTGDAEAREAFALLAECVAQRRPRAVPGAVAVRTPARFHLGMFSFGDPRVRSFGGTGLMLEEPAIDLVVTSAPSFGASGPLAERAVAFARHAAAAFGLPADRAFHVEVRSAPRSHVGLGSGTQLALAVTAAIEALAVRPAGGERSYEPAEALALAGRAGRGRRSSVGAYGFACGGLVVEAGRLGAGKVAAEGDTSPLVARATLPTEWRGVLVVEKDAEGLQGVAEREAFRTLPPVDPGVTAELARLALLGLVPAALEGRFDAFAEAFGAYGRLAGVPFEPASRGLPFHDSIQSLLARLGGLGFVGAAQSSWGPAVLAWCRSETDAEGLVRTLADEGLARTHALTIVRSSGAGARLRPLG